jgi:hypothetical protein
MPDWLRPVIGLADAAARSAGPGGRPHAGRDEGGRDGDPPAPRGAAAHRARRAGARLALGQDVLTAWLPARRRRRLAGQATTCAPARSPARGPCPSPGADRPPARPRPPAGARPLRDVSLRASTGRSADRRLA